MSSIKSIGLMIVTLWLLVVHNLTIADELIHYDNKGRAVNQYQCDKVSTHKSTHQDTLVCSRKGGADINNLSMTVIRNIEEAKNCKKDRNCVVIDNPRDPHWIAIALRGIPDAVFGPNIGGGSCAVIRESKPAESTWASKIWRLCTDNPKVDIAYTYALGYSNENVDPRFKAKGAKRVCFVDVLRSYKFRKYWKDNCIFIRPAGRPVVNFR